MFKWFKGFGCLFSILLSVIAIILAIILINVLIRVDYVAIAQEFKDLLTELSQRLNNL